LQLNATSFSAWHSSHRTRRKPCSSRPHLRYASNSSSQRTAAAVAQTLRVRQRTPGSTARRSHRAGSVRDGAARNRAGRRTWAPERRFAQPSRASLRLTMGSERRRPRASAPGPNPKHSERFSDALNRCAAGSLRSASSWTLGIQSNPRKGLTRIETGALR
jgi:hypothetical protein